MELQINGARYTVAPDYEADVLLWFLRDQLGLTGTKFGCGMGICGVCTVQVEGEPVRACVTPLATIAGRTIRTIEGLAGEAGLHPVQQAFLDEQVPQCGWCMSGQMMTAAALLARNPNPTPAEIEAALNQNYCRCGCYGRIRTAVARAAQAMRTTTEASL